MGAVEIRDATIHYPDRATPAIDRITETLETGELVVLTGPSGCGKSTLCRAIAGFIPELIPARVEGELRVGDASAWEADSARLAERVGLVQQDPDAQICTLGVVREVAFGPENLCLPPNEVADRVDRALAAVGIDHLRHRDTTTLSGGEKQRLAIASILAMEPEILVLDEPTANLDPEGAKGVFDLLGELRQRRGITTLVVEHRVRPLLSQAPRLLVLDRGRLVDRHVERRRIDPEEMGWGDGTAPAPNEAPSGPSILSVSDLEFGYDRPLLGDVTFDLRAGEVLGVIGPNGGGKTTLLRLLADLEQPTGGRIVRTGDPARGFVLQHPHHQIFERTVRRELEVDGAEREPGEIDRRLRQGRLGGLPEAPPLSLSLGEQRRLTLLAALRRRPRILLLDEPFIGQDRRNVEWIVSRIRAHCGGGGATVLVSHDVALVAALANRILFLDGGRDRPIYGPPSDVFGRLRAANRAAFLPGFWEEAT